MMTNVGLGEVASARELEVPKINYKKATEYGFLIDCLNALSLKYPAVKLDTLGLSVMGRDIPVVTLGGKKSSPGVIYIGGYRGDDALTPAVLLRFIGDYAESLSESRRSYSVSMPSLYEMRTIHIVPMLNPDGYVIRREGIDDIPRADYLREKNGGDDFSSWKYSARGVDISRSFSINGEFGGEFACTNDPETSALTRYVGMASVGVFGEIKLALSLLCEGSGIKYRSRRSIAPRAKTIGRLLERMSGEEIDDGELLAGGFSEWFVSQINRPAFDFGCEGETADDYVNLYATLREVLFSSPLLI